MQSHKAFCGHRRYHTQTTHMHTCFSAHYLHHLHAYAQYAPTVTMQHKKHSTTMQQARHALHTALRFSSPNSHQILPTASAHSHSQMSGTETSPTAAPIFSTYTSPNLAYTHAPSYTYIQLRRQCLVKTPKPRQHGCNVRQFLAFDLPHPAHLPRLSPNAHNHADAHETLPSALPAFYLPLLTVNHHNPQPVTRYIACYIMQLYKAPFADIRRPMQSNSHAHTYSYPQ